MAMRRRHDGWVPPSCADIDNSAPTLRGVASPVPIDALQDQASIILTLDIAGRWADLSP